MSKLKLKIHWSLGVYVINSSVKNRVKNKTLNIHIVLTLLWGNLDNGKEILKKKNNVEAKCIQVEA